MKKLIFGIFALSIGIIIFWANANSNANAMTTVDKELLLRRARSVARDFDGNRYNSKYFSHVGKNGMRVSLSKKDEDEYYFTVLDSETCNTVVFTAVIEKEIMKVSLESAELQDKD